MLTGFQFVCPLSGWLKQSLTDLGESFCVDRLREMEGPWLISESIPIRGLDVRIFDHLYFTNNGSIKSTAAYYN